MHELFINLNKKKTPNKNKDTVNVNAFSDPICWTTLFKRASDPVTIKQLNYKSPTQYSQY